jgi:serine/threonine protein kinase
MNYNEAGRVIGAGGFGCVFNPSLKCKNKKMGKNLISKLSIKKEVAKEQAVNDRIKPIILKIKNHNKYFLINRIFSCSPKPLNKKDLENFNKCVTLLNAGYTEENINKNLDKFDILNVPYGGEDLSDVFVEKGKGLKEDFLFFNKKFIDLLENAIYPMNKLGLIHCDMKSSNLLIDMKNKNNRLGIIKYN